MPALEGVEELLRSVKYAIVPYTRGTGIDIGIGPRKAYSRFVAVRERGDKTPVLMLTSESKRSVVSTVMKLGIEDYILKPFKPEELKAKVSKVLKDLGLRR